MTSKSYRKVIDNLTDEEINDILKAWEVEPTDNRKINEEIISDVLEAYDADPEKMKTSKDIIKAYFENEEEFKKDWKAEIRARAKTPRQKEIDRLQREIETKTRELMKLRQEEKEFNERYKENWKDIEWVIDNYQSGNTTNENLKIVDKVMTELYKQPYGTEIPFHKMDQNELAELGNRLKVWYEKTIGNAELRDRIRVSFWLKNGDFKQLPLHQCGNKLLNMFSGSTVFSADTLTSGFSSDDGEYVYQMFDTIMFELLEKPIMTNTKSGHESGFLPYRTSKEVQKNELMIEKLERYQVYGNFFQSERSTIEHKIQCLVHALRMAGIDEKTCLAIANFTDYRRYNELNVLKDIYANFGIRTRVRFIRPDKGRIDFINWHNKGFHGKDGKNIRSVELCIFEKHTMVFDDNITWISLFYIRNIKAINEYADKHGIDYETRCLYNCFKRGKPYFDKSKHHPINTLQLMKALMENGHLIPIKALDNDFVKSAINPTFAEKQELQAEPLNKLSTKPIERKWKDSKFNENNVFYADFETCKKYDEKLKSFVAVEMMLCVQNYDATFKKTYIGLDCGYQMCEELPDGCLVYFHNLGFDGRLLMKCGVSNMIKVGSKVISEDIKYQNKTIHLRDSYSMLTQPLKSFPKSFPKAFEGTNIQKELFPYDYYTHERINEGAIGNVNEAVKVAKWNKDEEKIFRDNLIKTDSLINDEEFDMLKYCEFYCQQDVNVLRVGFNAFRNATLQDPINLDVFEYLTAPSLANDWMMQHVFLPNGNLFKVGGKLRDFIQKCVYGGRCMTRDNKRWFINEILDDFDACSLYPSAMARLFTVEGIPKYEKFAAYEVYDENNLPFILRHAFTEDQIEPTKTRFISQFFVRIKIHSIGIHRHFPLIVKREPTKQTNVNECVEMYVDLIMLEDLIKYQKISFSIIEGYIMKGRRDHRIREAITKLFNKRAEFKKENNPVQQTIKLIMNSAYGKTIQKPIKNFTKYVDEQKKDQIFWNSFNSISCATKINDSDLWAIEKFRRKDIQYNNAVFGVSVLSMSKRIMNEVMCLAEDLNINIYYQDTDSMHIEHNKLPLLAEEFKKLYGRELIGENKLGCFHNDFDELKNAYAILHISCGKKVYFDLLTNDKGEEAIHFRMKGAPQKSIINAAKEFHDETEGANINADIMKLYKHIYDGGTVTVDLIKGGSLFKMNKNGVIEYLKKSQRRVKSTAQK